MYLPGRVQKAFKPGEEGKVKYEDGRVSFSMKWGGLRESAPALNFEQAFSSSLFSSHVLCARSAGRRAFVRRVR